MENMVLGLEVTLFGMGATFLALGVLAIMLNVLRIVFAQKTGPTVQPVTDSVPTAPAGHTVRSAENHPDDLIVVIAAAVAAVMTDEQGDSVNHRITSITPVKGAGNADGLNLASAK